MKHFSKATLIPTLWLLSFLGSFLALPVSDSLQTAAVVTLVTGLVGYVVSTGKFQFKYNFLTLLLMMLWVVAAVSVVASEIPFVSLTYFFFFSVFPLTFLLFSFVDGANLLKPIRLIILALSICNLIQFYFMPDMLKFGGAHWPFADNNSLAAVLASCAVMFIGEALRGGKFVYYYILAAVILFAGVMTTGGVAVFFGLFLVIGVMAWLAKPSTYKPVGAFIIVAFILMCVMTTSDMSIYHFMGNWSQSVDVFTNTGLVAPNHVSGSRLTIWESALNIFKDYIWAGTGIGTFFLYYPEYRNMIDDTAGYAVHNDLLQFALEMGFLAPLLALVIVGYVIYQTVRHLKGIIDTHHRLNILIPFAVFGLIIGHSLVNFNLYVLTTLMILGAMLAIWGRHVHRKEIICEGQKTFREAISFITVMIILVPLWGCYLSEYYTTKATESLAKEDIQGFSDNLNKADTWGAGQNGRAVLNAAKFASAINQPERALELLDRAQSLNPRLMQIYVERARILSLTDPQKALDEASYALHLDKGAITARLMMVEILEKMNKPEEAYEVLRDGLGGAITSRTPLPFYQLLATKSLERGDMKTNEFVLKRMSEIKGDGFKH